MVNQMENILLPIVDVTLNLKNNEQNSKRVSNNIAGSNY